ncbi:MAG: formylmethanofuran dehydrogenase subunit E family protein [Candidatus Bathyarchaeia archaeon]
MEKTLIDLVKKAEEFHGHLGPFLVLGLKAGLFGLKKLKIDKNKNKELLTTAMLDYSIPFSCIIDGLQISTGCTIGNKRLIVKNSSNFLIEFFNKKDNKRIAILIDQKILNRIRDELKAENKNSKKVLELAEKIVSMVDDELFIIHENNLD